MKTLFIQIDDPSQIDTAKTTVYDLNKRYIDHAGNMYGLRYNRGLKKIEVIKIMRTTAKNESYFTQKMIQQKKVNAATDTEHESMEQDEDNYEAAEQTHREEDYEIDPVTFREDLFTLMLTHKERLNTIVKNIYNSKLIPRENRDATAKLDELFRNIDIDCAQRIDKIINSYREMTEYPRSLNYYIGRLDNRARDLITEIRSEESKLNFVILHEMHTQSRDLFTALKKMLANLSSFLKEHSENRLAKISALEKQALGDAITSIDSTIREIHTESEKLVAFEKYIYTLANFQRK
jgi:hypothetical protein